MKKIMMFEVTAPTNTSAGYLYIDVAGVKVGDMCIVQRKSDYDNMIAFHVTSSVVVNANRIRVNFNQVPTASSDMTFTCIVFKQ